MNLDWIVALAIPPVMTLMAIAILARSRWAEMLADTPNERPLHETPTPRIGGIAILVGAVPCAATLGGSTVAVPLAGAVALAIVSAIDDARNLPIEVRLPAHLGAAALVVLALGPVLPDEGVLAIGASVAAVIAIAWMANLYNFMDGADGLAGSMTLVGFGSLSAAAAVSHHAPLALVCAAIAASALGFLSANFPPARVFMGDAGSVPLGFLAGALGLQGGMEGVWPLWLPLLVFSPFIVDATVTLLKRIVRGERIWRAHREHAYQRLVLAGWTRKRLAFSALVLMVACALSAVAGFVSGEKVRFGILLGWAAIYALLLVAVERKVRAANRPTGGVDGKNLPGR